LLHMQLWFVVFLFAGSCFCKQLVSDGHEGGEEVLFLPMIWRAPRREKESLDFSLKSPDLYTNFGAFCYERNSDLYMDFLGHCSYSCSLFAIPFAAQRWGCMTSLIRANDSIDLSQCHYEVRFFFCLTWWLWLA
jgi:hypothetical protein